MAWQQMPTFGGIAANLQETLIGFVSFVFVFSPPNQQGWKESEEVMN